VSLACFPWKSSLDKRLRDEDSALEWFCTKILATLLFAHIHAIVWNDWRCDSLESKSIIRINRTKQHRHILPFKLIKYIHVYIFCFGSFLDVTLS
jgi:hypothetical protein